MAAFEPTDARRACPTSVVFGFGPLKSERKSPAFMLPSDDRRFSQSRNMACTFENTFRAVFHHQATTNAEQINRALNRFEISLSSRRDRTFAAQGQDRLISLSRNDRDFRTNPQHSRVTQQRVRGNPKRGPVTAGVRTPCFSMAKSHRENRI